jgi:hypothetical protein
MIRLPISVEDYRNFVLNHRGAFNEVAEALLAQGEKEKARDIVLYGLEKMPDKGVPYDVSNARNVEVLFEVGEKEKAIEVATVLGKRMDEWLLTIWINKIMIMIYTTALLYWANYSVFCTVYGEAELSEEVRRCL